MQDVTRIRSSTTVSADSSVSTSTCENSTYDSASNDGTPESSLFWFLCDQDGTVPKSGSWLNREGFGIQVATNEGCSSPDRPQFSFGDQDLATVDSDERSYSMQSVLDSWDVDIKDFVSYSTQLRHGRLVQLLMNHILLGQWQPARCFLSKLVRTRPTVARSFLASILRDPAASFRMRSPTIQSPEHLAWLCVNECLTYFPDMISEEMTCHIEACLIIRFASNHFMECSQQSPEKTAATREPQISEDTIHWVNALINEKPTLGAAVSHILTSPSMHDIARLHGDATLRSKLLRCQLAHVGSSFRSNAIQQGLHHLCLIDVRESDLPENEAHDMMDAIEHAFFDKYGSGKDAAYAMLIAACSSQHSTYLYQLVWNRQRSRLSEQLGSPACLAAAIDQCDIADINRLWHALCLYSASSCQIVTELIAEAASECAQNGNSRALLKLLSFPQVAPFKSRLFMWLWPFLVHDPALAIRVHGALTEFSLSPDACLETSQPNTSVALSSSNKLMAVEFTPSRHHDSMLTEISNQDTDRKFSHDHLSIETRSAQSSSSSSIAATPVNDVSVSSASRIATSPVSGHIVNTSSVPSSLPSARTEFIDDYFSKMTSYQIEFFKAITAHCKSQANGTSNGLYTNSREHLDILASKADMSHEDARMAMIDIVERRPTLSLEDKAVKIAHLDLLYGTCVVSVAVNSLLDIHHGSRTNMPAPRNPDTRYIREFSAFLEKINFPPIMLATLEAVFSLIFLTKEDFADSFCERLLPEQSSHPQNKAKSSIVEPQFICNAASIQLLCEFARLGLELMPDNLQNYNFEHHSRNQIEQQKSQACDTDQGDECLSLAYNLLKSSTSVSLNEFRSRRAALKRRLMETTWRISLFLQTRNLISARHLFDTSSPKNSNSTWSDETATLRFLLADPTSLLITSIKAGYYEEAASVIHLYGLKGEVADDAQFAQQLANVSTSLVQHTNIEQNIDLLLSQTSPMIGLRTVLDLVLTSVNSIQEYNLLLNHAHVLLRKITSSDGNDNSENTLQRSDSQSTSDNGGCDLSLKTSCNRDLVRCAPVHESKDVIDPTKSQEHLQECAFYTDSLCSDGSSDYHSQSLGLEKEKTSCGENKDVLITITDTDLMTNDPLAWYSHFIQLLKNTGQILNKPMSCILLQEDSPFDATTAKAKTDRYGTLRDALIAFSDILTITAPTEAQKQQMMNCAKQLQAAVGQSCIIGDSFPYLSKVLEQLNLMLTAVKSAFPTRHDISIRTILNESSTKMIVQSVLASNSRMQIDQAHNLCNALSLDLFYLLAREVMTQQTIIPSSGTTNNVSPSSLARSRYGIFHYRALMLAGSCPLIILNKTSDRLTRPSNFFDETMDACTCSHDLLRDLLRLLMKTAQYFRGKDSPDTEHICSIVFSAEFRHKILQSPEYKTWQRQAEALSWTKFSTLTIVERQCAYVNVINLLRLHGSIEMTPPSGLADHEEWAALVGYDLGAIGSISLKDLESALFRRPISQTRIFGLSQDLHSVMIPEDHPLADYMLGKYSPDLLYLIWRGEFSSPSPTAVIPSSLDTAIVNMRAQFHLRGVQISSPQQLEVSPYFLWFASEFGLKHGKFLANQCARKNTVLLSDGAQHTHSSSFTVKETNNFQTSPKQNQHLKHDNVYPPTDFNNFSHSDLDTKLPRAQPRVNIASVRVDQNEAISELVTYTTLHLPTHIGESSLTKGIHSVHVASYHFDPACLVHVGGIDLEIGQVSSIATANLEDLARGGPHRVMPSQFAFIRQPLPQDILDYLQQAESTMFSLAVVFSEFTGLLESSTKKGNLRRPAKTQSDDQSSDDRSFRGSMRDAQYSTLPSEGNMVNDRPRGCDNNSISMTNQKTSPTQPDSFKYERARSDEHAVKSSWHRVDRTESVISESSNMGHSSTSDLFRPRGLFLEFQRYVRRCHASPLYTMVQERLRPFHALSSKAQFIAEEVCFDPCPIAGIAFSARPLQAFLLEYHSNPARTYVVFRLIEQWLQAELFIDAYHFFSSVEGTYCSITHDRLLEACIIHEEQAQRKFAHYVSRFENCVLGAQVALANLHLLSSQETLDVLQLFHENLVHASKTSAAAIRDDVPVSCLHSLRMAALTELIQTVHLQIQRTHILQRVMAVCGNVIPSWHVLVQLAMKSSNDLGLQRCYPSLQQNKTPKRTSKHDSKTADETIRPSTDIFRHEDIILSTLLKKKELSLAREWAQMQQTSQDVVWTRHIDNMLALGQKEEALTELERLPQNIALRACECVLQSSLISPLKKICDVTCTDKELKCHDHVNELDTSPNIAEVDSLSSAICDNQLPYTSTPVRHNRDPKSQYTPASPTTLQHISKIRKDFQQPVVESSQTLFAPSGPIRIFQTNDEQWNIIDQTSLLDTVYLKGLLLLCSFLQERSHDTAATDWGLNFDGTVSHYCKIILKMLVTIPPNMRRGLLHIALKPNRIFEQILMGRHIEVAQQILSNLDEIDKHIILDLDGKDDLVFYLPYPSPNVTCGEPSDTSSMGTSTSFGNSSLASINRVRLADSRTFVQRRSIENLDESMTSIFSLRHQPNLQLGISTRRQRIVDTCDLLLFYARKAMVLVSGDWVTQSLQRISEPETDATKHTSLDESRNEHSPAVTRGMEIVQDRSFLRAVLQTDEQTLLRRTFEFESHPDFVLASTLLDMHPNADKAAQACVDLAQDLSSSLSSGVAVDQYAVSTTVYQLLYMARIKFLKAGMLEREGECAALLRRAELIRVLVARGCDTRLLPSVDGLGRPERVRRLQQRLLKQHEFDLAYKVAIKCGGDQQHVLLQWGISFLHTRSYDRAREKLVAVLQFSNRPLVYLERILEELQKPTTLEVGELGEDCSDLHFLCRDLRELAKKTKVTGGQSRRKRETALSHRLPCNGLPPIAVTSDTRGRVSMVSNMDMERIELARYLCLEICNEPGLLLTLYVNHGMYDTAAKITLEKNVAPEVYFDRVIQPIITLQRLAGTFGFADSTSDFGVLLECMDIACAARARHDKGAQKGREAWTPYAKLACSRLGASGQLQPVYRLQLFVYDHYGAIETCVKFATQSGISNDLREEWYQQATKHLQMLELARITTQSFPNVANGDGLTEEDQALLRLKLQWQHLGATTFINLVCQNSDDSSKESNNAVELDVLLQLNLFHSKVMAQQMATEMLARSKTDLQAILENVIVMSQRLNLDINAILMASCKKLAVLRETELLVEILDRSRDYFADTEALDNLLDTLATIYVEKHDATQPAQHFVQRMSSGSNRVGTLISVGLVRQAFKAAIESDEKAENVRRVRCAAETAKKHRIAQICTDWLSRHAPS